MQIVIEISKEMLSALKSGKLKHGSVAEEMIVEAVKDGTPLPKGHGRLIDADNLMEYCLNQKSKTIDCNDIARFGTIIPADKEESE